MKNERHRVEHQNLQLPLRLSAISFQTIRWFWITHTGHISCLLSQNHLSNVMQFLKEIMIQQSFKKQQQRNKAFCAVTCSICQVATVHVLTFVRVTGDTKQTLPMRFNGATWGEVLHYWLEVLPVTFVKLWALGPCCVYVPLQQTANAAALMWQRVSFWKRQKLNIVCVPLNPPCLSPILPSRSVFTLRYSYSFLHSRPPPLFY